MAFAAGGRHSAAAFDANATSSAVAGFEQRRIMHAIGCRDGNHAERVASIDINAILLAIIVQRLVNEFDNLMGVRLRTKGIRSRTSGMFVRPVTCFAKKERCKKN